jgi:hypothetical protein
LRAAAVVFVGAWYLAATTGMPFWLASPSKTVAVLDFPCASHGCNCRTAEQCATSCCCFPVDVEMDPGCPMHAGASVASGPVSVRVTAIATARCAPGAEEKAAFSANVLGPHEPRSTTEEGAMLATVRGVATQPGIPTEPDIDRPDKVPISRS